MRWLAVVIALCACGRGHGYLEAPCADDRDCEPGLSCQDPNGVTECYPDGTVGCKAQRDCPSGESCVPYGTGAFCRPLPGDDLSVTDGDARD